MRYGSATLLMLITSVVSASAQDPFSVLTKKEEARVSPDEVVARLMSFDRNGDGRVAVDELSERMQGLVARGDRGGDGALDASEIRSLTQTPLQFVQAARLRLQGGGYSFGDTSGLSSTRSHIENTIEDLRLAPQANQEARRIATAFADNLDNTAHANLKTAIAPMLTEAQLAEFETNLKRSARTIRFTSSNGTPAQTQTVTIGADPSSLLRRYALTPEQVKIAAAAAETFKAEQQLDDVRRSALVAQMSDIFTDEERENFSAALARRPLVKGLGAVASFQAAIDTVRVEFPGNGVPVREIGFTDVPAASTSR